MRANAMARVTGLVAALSLTGSAFVVAFAGPSQAAGCVSYNLSENRRAVVVENGCSDTRRVKVVWTRATDSACTQLDAYGGRLIDSRGYPADFDRIESC